MNVDRMLSILTALGGAIVIAYIAIAGEHRSSYILAGLFVAIAMVGALRWYRKPPERPLRAFVIMAVAVIIALVVVLALTTYSLTRAFSPPSNTDSGHANSSSIDGQFPSDTKVINVDFPAKTCVNLHGVQAKAVVSKVGCGSSDNNFIVVQQVKTPHHSTNRTFSGVARAEMTGGRWAMYRA